MSHQKDTEASLKGLPLGKYGRIISMKIKIVIDYDALNKRGIHEPILT